MSTNCTDTIFPGTAELLFKRRVNRICLIERFTSFAELRYTLINEPEYLKRFVEEVTVNVTEMFRDPHFFKGLREKILPQLGTYPLIRIWVAGCSTGEEAYSMAILLKEANLYHKSLIYGTDLNPSVLETARAGVFPLQQMKLYSENYMLSGGKKIFQIIILRIMTVLNLIKAFRRSLFYLRTIWFRIAHLTAFS